MLEKCQNTEFFLVRIYCIQSEYRKIRTKKNSIFGHFSRSGKANKREDISNATQKTNADSCLTKFFWVIYYSKNQSANVPDRNIKSKSCLIQKQLPRGVL